MSFYFMLDRDPNTDAEPDPECIQVPVPLMQKFPVPAVPVPHY
jgi:hypothetical protein